MGSRLRLQPEFFVRPRLARRRTTMGSGTKAIRQDYDRELRRGRERLYGCGDRSGLSRGRRIGESQLNIKRLAWLYFSGGGGGAFCPLLASTSFRTGGATMSNNCAFGFWAASNKANCSVAHAAGARSPRSM